MRSPLLSTLTALLLLAPAVARAQEGGEGGGEDSSEGGERPGSDSPEAVTRARAREGFGPRRRAQAFLIPLDEHARGPTGRVAQAIERALTAARQYEVVDLAKALAADAVPDQVAKAQAARKLLGEAHEAFGARRFPEAVLKYREAANLFAKGLADTDARELAEVYLRLATAQKLAGDPKAARDGFLQAALLDPQQRVKPAAVDPAAEGPMLGARADVDAGGVGALEVEPRPHGAKVFVDGVFKGHAPARLDLPVGRHLVRLERTGFFPAAEWVEVKGGKEASFALTMQATPGAAALNQVIAGAVEEASRGTTGPQTSKLAERFSLERVLIGSVASHGLKVSILLALADPKQIKVLGKSDLLLVADGTDADQVEADTQAAARKLFALDASADDGAPSPAPAAASARPLPPPAIPAPAAASAAPPPAYPGMMGAQAAPADGVRRPVMPGAAAPAAEPADDPGLVGKERKVAAPSAPSEEGARAAADAPAPEKPAGEAEKKDVKKKKGLKGKSGTEKWGD